MTLKGLGQSRQQCPCWLWHCHSTWWQCQHTQVRSRPALPSSEALLVPNQLHNRPMLGLATTLMWWRIPTVFCSRLSCLLGMNSQVLISLEGQDRSRHSQLWPFHPETLSSPPYAPANCFAFTETKSLHSRQLPRLITMTVIIYITRVFQRLQTASKVPLRCGHRQTWKYL